MFAVRQEDRRMRVPYIGRRFGPLRQYLPRVFARSLHRSPRARTRVWTSQNPVSTGQQIVCCVKKNPRLSCTSVS